MLFHSFSEKADSATPNFSVINFLKSKPFLLPPFYLYIKHFYLDINSKTECKQASVYKTMSETINMSSSNYI